ncbi:MAG: hypothetical protein GC179_25310 [Anaerolineaceae bacterium]|nr:hypothetical protein [Anaerolineaceae bacterium]
MPFVFIWGMPNAVHDAQLLELRETIIGRLADKMAVAHNWVRVFFPSERLSDYAVPDEGSSTIYITIETGLFNSEGEDSKDPIGTTQIIAETVWNMFGGQYEVECFIGNHNPKWVSLIHAKID